MLPKTYTAGTAKHRPATQALSFSIWTPWILHQIREYSQKAFVIAVTGQERTGPVMEAATWGAYEIMRRPLRKERIDGSCAN